MKRNKHQFIILVLFLQAAFFCKAQKDTLIPLSCNPILQHYVAPNIHANAKALAISDTLELPFYDDFSGNGPYPDAAKWLNSSSVFINRTWAKNPPTLGVATFDGLKANGYPYFPLGSAGSVKTDTLSSKFIRLDSITFPPVAITPADSVYLSFSYQPKGFSSSPPLSTNTLKVDFYNPTTMVWTNVLTLSRSGNSPKDSLFTRVMIPIKDPAYFKKQFRFRFRNLNPGTGAVAQWHVDNVYLSKDRSIIDTSFSDLAFVYPPQTLLNKYTAMPYKHYTGATQMAAHSYLKIRNNDRFATNFTAYMSINNSLGVNVLYDTTGSDNALPFATNGYISNPDITDFLTSTVSPSIDTFVYNNGNPLTDSITYYVKHYMRTSASDRNKANDTIVYEQKFHNYFAYDDGTAEAAWGLGGAIGAEAALQFQLTKPDTMRAIDIFFIPTPSPPPWSSTVTQIENLVFGLCVWNDIGGIPGSYLYNDNNTMLRNPIHRAWGNNVFVRYYLNYPLIMNAGTFYAGFKQDLDQLLCIGYDQNFNNQDKLFQNTTGIWEHPFWPGTLMLRPVFGDSAWAATGMKAVSEKEITTIIYPNPASNEINVKSNDNNQSLSIEITDALGKTVVQKNNCTTETISIAELETGFYFARIFANNKLIATHKLIISR